MSAMKESLETFKLIYYQLAKGSISRTLPRRSNQIFRRFSSRRMQRMVLQCITANIAQRMMWRFTEENSAEKCLPPCFWLQHCVNTDTSKMLVAFEEAQEAKSWKEFLLLREKLSHGAVYLIERHDCHNITEKPDFYCFEHKFWKFPSFSVLICWKFKYKKSLLPNDLKWIQLYSSHAESVECPKSNFPEGQTQQQLWLNTPQYILLSVVFFCTWSSHWFQCISGFKLAIDQSHPGWQSEMYPLVQPRGQGEMLKLYKHVHWISELLGSKQHYKVLSLLLTYALDNLDWLNSG